MNLSPATPTRIQLRGLAPYSSQVTVNTQYRVMTPQGSQGRLRIEHYCDHREHAEHNAELLGGNFQKI